MSEPKETRPVNIMTFVYMAVSLLMIQLISGILMLKFMPEPDMHGTFGDMFGAVNTAFSGLALAGIIYTIILQQRSLSLQQRELELTRNELKRTAEANEAQQEWVEAQAQASEISAVIGLADKLHDTFSHQLSRIPRESSDEDRARRKAISKKILFLENLMEATFQKKFGHSVEDLLHRGRTKAE